MYPKVNGCTHSSKAPHVVYMDTVHSGGFFYAGMAPLKNDSPRLSIAE